MIPQSRVSLENAMQMAIYNLLMHGIDIVEEACSVKMPIL